MLCNITHELIVLNIEDMKKGGCSLLDPIQEIEKEYKQKYPYMYKFLSKLTKDQDKIHDIIQDVFLTILKNPKILLEVRNRNAWFIQLAKNKYIDRLRKKSEKLIDEEYFFNSIKNTENSEERVTQNEQIEEALSLLSKEDREYVLAKYYFGFSFEEIAEITGKSPPSIRTRVYRAKKLMLEKVKLYE